MSILPTGGPGRIKLPGQQPEVLTLWIQLNIVGDLEVSLYLPNILKTLLAVSEVKPSTNSRIAHRDMKASVWLILSLLVQLPQCHQSNPALYNIEVPHQHVIEDCGVASPAVAKCCNVAVQYVLFLVAVPKPFGEAGSFELPGGQKLPNSCVGKTVHHCRWLKSGVVYAISFL